MATWTPRPPNGRKIRRDAVDHGYRAPQAITNYKRRMSGSTKPVVIYGYGTADTEARSGFVNDDKIPFLPHSFSAKIADPTGKNGNVPQATPWRSVSIRAAAVMLVATVLSGCGSRPETIVASNEALCQYSVTAGDARSYAECRDRLLSRDGRRNAASATRIEGYALLQDQRPAGAARRCDISEGPKNCDPGDLTGSIPVSPKH